MGRLFHILFRTKRFVYRFTLGTFTGIVEQVNNLPVMSYKSFITLLLFVYFLMSACTTAKPYATSSVDNWLKMATANDVDIFVDTTSIKTTGSITLAVEKRLFLTAESKAEYVDKIRKEYSKMGKAEKTAKWNDFSYCLYYSEYECINNRFLVLWVEDYDSSGKRIVRTTPAKGKDGWINITDETVGDYTFFYICDFGN